MEVLNALGISEEDRSVNLQIISSSIYFLPEVRGWIFI